METVEIPKGMSVKELKNTLNINIPKEELRSRKKIKEIANSFDMLSNIVANSSQKAYIENRELIKNQLSKVSHLILELLEKYENEYFLNELYLMEIGGLNEKLKKEKLNG